MYKNLQIEKEFKEFFRELWQLIFKKSLNL